MLRNKPSHILERYQALGCVADGKIELGVMEEDTIVAKITSSDANSVYSISYCQSENTIKSDESFSHKNNTLLYPSLALLLFLDVLDYQESYGNLFVDMLWRRLLVEHTDLDILQYQIDEKLKKSGADMFSVYTYCDGLSMQLESLNLQDNT